MPRERPRRRPGAGGSWRQRRSGCRWWRRCGWARWPGRRSRWGRDGAGRPGGALPNARRRRGGPRLGTTAPTSSCASTTAGRGARGWGVAKLFLQGQWRSRAENGHPRPRCRLLCQPREGALASAVINRRHPSHPSTACWLEGRRCHIPSCSRRDDGPAPQPIPAPPSPALPPAPSDIPHRLARASLSVAPAHPAAAQPRAPTHQGQGARGKHCKMYILGAYDCYQIAQ